MMVDLEIQEAEMVAACVPPERTAAEVWIADHLPVATSHHTVLNDAATDKADLERRRARANLIAALLAASRQGLSAVELQVEFSAAFNEVFNPDGSLRDLAGTYGWRERAGDDV